MANKSLFRNIAGRFIPDTNVLNHETAPAYLFTPKHMLAQYAATGCMNSTFYADAKDQLEAVLNLCNEVESEFIAKTAVFTRRESMMKDMPALLCAVLSVKSPVLLDAIFDQVIDNGKMLRNFVQIMRSGAVGRKSLGTAPKRLVRRWLENRSNESIFRASVGASPSIADIIKMVHPKPADETREALYGYLIGRETDAGKLPELVQAFEAFKKDESAETPDVPFQMLTSKTLDETGWKTIARNAGWHATRMNLNTFARHGVLNDPELVDVIAQRLRNPSEVKKSRVFPYQLLAAYKSAVQTMPLVIMDAIEESLEIATENVPKINGKVVVCPDVSGSMTFTAATGFRKGSTSAVRCIDAAALFAAVILRKNRNAQLLPFENSVVDVRVNPRDSILGNADKLSRIGGGGTNCSAPLVRLNKEKADVDMVVFISDNESWVDAGHGRGTETMRQWNILKKRNPDARLVCIDIQPYGTTQAAERNDILNIGGFSDNIFNVIREFAEGRLGSDHWVGIIEEMNIGDS